MSENAGHAPTRPWLESAEQGDNVQFPPSTSFPLSFLLLPHFPFPPPNPLSILHFLPVFFRTPLSACGAIQVLYAFAFVVVVRDDEHCTALMLAAAAGHALVMKILLDNHASVNEVDKMKVDFLFSVFTK